MSELGLPKEFWVEAINTAIYFVNFFPYSAINFSTSFELGHKQMTDFSGLRIFGCTTCSLTPKKHKTKLDPTSKKCHFLGCASGVKDYSL